MLFAKHLNQLHEPYYNVLKDIIMKGEGMKGRFGDEWKFGDGL